MKTLKITNEGSGYYSVIVDHVGGNTTEHDFDSHDEMSEFVDSLKSKGYTVVNKFI